MPRSTTICRSAAHALRDAGATVEEIAFDVSDGREPYQAWRGALDGRAAIRQPRRSSSSSAPTCKGNVKAGLKVTRARFRRRRADARSEVFQRFRELFERYDVLLTPAAPVKPFPVEMNFPTEINGQKLDNYIDWIAPAFLITLVSLPGRQRAGRHDQRRPAGRHADRRRRASRSR